jgi:hypothetical protein
MLGASLGVMPGALEQLQDLFDFVGYHPQLHFDTSLPLGLIPTVPGTGDYARCRVWQGPLGPVVILKADGTPTYASHDLTYVQLIQPNFYITGSEQQGHFAALGRREAPVDGTGPRPGWQEGQEQRGPAATGE